MAAELGQAQASLLLVFNHHFSWFFLKHCVDFAHCPQNNPNRSFLIMRNLDIADILRPIVLLGDELDVLIVDEFITGGVKECNRDVSV